jgi:hypothetical protein
MDRQDQRLGSCVNPLYIPLTRFDGDWADDLAHMTELAKPFSFDLRGKPRLQNNNEMEKNDFDRWGYVTEGDNPYIVFNRAKAELVGKLKKISELFHLDIPTVSRVDIQYPGQMTPCHMDHMYDFYSAERTRWDDAHVQRKIHCIITPWEPGHYMCWGNDTITHWEQGAGFAWNWGLPHWTANLGKNPRVSLVFSVKGDITDEELKNGMGETL